MHYPSRLDSGSNPDTAPHASRPFSEPDAVSLAAASDLNVARSTRANLLVLGPEQLVKNAKTSWEARTGGTVEITTLDFGDVPIKYAGVIASGDPSVDVLYTYAGFMGQFGDRIYDDLTTLVPDTSAWLPSTLEVMSPAGVLRALPVHSETEIFIYNKQMFEDAGADPENHLPPGRLSNADIPEVERRGLRVEDTAAGIEEDPSLSAG